jgi:hypothetical protein
MNPQAIFVQCLNEASLKCAFTVVVDYSVVKDRLLSLKNEAEKKLQTIKLCRLHENQAAGCFCRLIMRRTTADRIADIKKKLTAAIFAQMLTWPEFNHLRIPNSTIHFHYVPIQKQ